MSGRVKVQRFAFGLPKQRGLVRIGTWLLATLAFSIVLGACTTTKKAAQLAIDHHVGMAHGAMDIMSGEAEAHEQRELPSPPTSTSRQ